MEKFFSSCYLGNLILLDVGTAWYRWNLDGKVAEERNSKMIFKYIYLVFLNDSVQFS